MNRLDLHTSLSSIRKNVYYQPSERARLTYPCIVYNQDYTDIQAAGNRPYKRSTVYNVTYMTKQADDSIEDEIYDAIPYCRKVNFMVNDGVYHEVYRVFH